MSGESAVILVVDDEKQNLRLIESILAPLGYRTILSGDGEDALVQVREHNPDLILLDIMMPVMDGFDVARRLKGDEETKIIPIVMVTSLGDLEDKVKALEAGADDFLVKPVDSVELKARIRSLLKVKAYNDTNRDYRKVLEREVNLKTGELRRAYDKIKAVSFETINRLSRAVEYLDESTSFHLQKISLYVTVIARELELGQVDIESLQWASPMHDVGKIGIPDGILMKPGKLSPEEWEIMKQHTVIGGKILEGSDEELIRVAETIALTHHEKWDGSGYPKGLKGDKIPLVGRITALADVFDALISRRPYKEAYPLDQSLDIIRKSMGSHFDPDAVRAFFSAEEEIRDISRRFSEK